MIRMDGIMIPELLEAVLQLFPLDNFVPNPVRLMRNLPTEPVPEIWETYEALLKKYDKDDAFKGFEYLKIATVFHKFLYGHYDTGAIVCTQSLIYSYSLRNEGLKCLFIESKRFCIQCAVIQRHHRYRVFLNEKRFSIFCC